MDSATYNHFRMPANPTRYIRNSSSTEEPQRRINKCFNEAFIKSRLGSQTGLFPEEFRKHRLKCTLQIRGLQQSLNLRLMELKLQNGTGHILQNV